jgi:hypothetical protein
MDVYAIDLQAPSAQAPDQGEHAVNPRARRKVSRARAVLTSIPAKTFTSANPASQSGLMAARGRQNSTIERTVPCRAYGRWTMFDQTFINTGSPSAGFHGVGGARRRAWMVFLARVARRESLGRCRSRYWFAWCSRGNRRSPLSGRFSRGRCGYPWPRRSPLTTPAVAAQGSHSHHIPYFF